VEATSKSYAGHGKVTSDLRKERVGFFKAERDLAFKDIQKAAEYYHVGMSERAGENFGKNGR